jgi:hypothetical protein
LLSDPQLRHRVANRSFDVKPHSPQGKTDAFLSAASSTIGEFRIDAGAVEDFEPCVLRISDSGAERNSSRTVNT